MNICFNGEFFPADSPLLTVQNKSYKWGDGLFETMKVHAGRLLLENYHFERLLMSLRLLEINVDDQFSQPRLVKSILALCKQNDCINGARIRLAVYRKDDHSAGYSIEAIPLSNEINEWPFIGQSICLYPFVRKSIDAFANIKSVNFLPYVMAAKYAQEKQMDDAIVLNTQNNLCDTSKANIFLVKGDQIYTPALHQGCINGVMRRVVIEEVKELGFGLYQEEITEENLLNADEVFLTNAIQMIRWVETYKQKSYTSIQTRKVFDAVSATIFHR